MQVGATPGEAIENSSEQLIYSLDEINFIAIAIIVVTAMLISWASRKFFPWLGKYTPTRYRLWILGLGPIIRLLTLLTAILLVLPMVLILHADNIIVILGALSVAIGFAFKDLVSSVIAGIVAVFERPYRPGDWVTVQDDYGEIKDMGLRSFTMVTPADDVITVAHDRLWQNNIANSNDGDDTLMCVTNLYLAPNHDSRKVRLLLKEVALTSPYLSYRKPVTVELSQAPYATHYKIKAYPFDMRDQFRFVSDITVRSKAELRAAGIAEATSITSVELDPES